MTDDAATMKATGKAFLAMSALLGEPFPIAAELLDATLRESVIELEAGFVSNDAGARALTISKAMLPVIQDLHIMRLR